VDAASFGGLAAFFRIVSKRRAVVLTTALILTTLAAIFSFKMKPVYQATTRVAIESETPLVQSLDEVYRTIPIEEKFLQTQVKVLQSENLAWETIEQLGLADNPAFAPKDRWARRGEPDPRIIRGQLLDLFSGHLDVELARNTHMVVVSFESTDPYLAARVANTLVNDYKEYNFRSLYEATRQASGWMEQQLDELKAKVEKSQEALVAYERENSIINVSDKQNLLEQRLSDLSKDLTNAQNDRSQKQSLYQQVKSNPQQVALLAQNELLVKLEEKYADIQSQYVDAQGQYGPNFPKVIRLQSQVNEIQSLIDQERNRTVQRIRKDYEAAVGRERIMSDLMVREKAEVGRLNQLLIQHNILKRDFETNQQMYENLLERLKDATVSAGLRASNVHLVDSAFPPAEPIRPKKFLYISVGLIAGVFLGIGLAFVAEGLDSSIKRAEDIERFIAAPTLAVIPSEETLGTSGRSWLKGQRIGASNGNGRVELAVLERPSSALAEAYRTLRTSLLLSTASKPAQVLLVASTQPQEGKTCTTLNLSLALAQRGRRVLVIDADLRRPGLGELVGSGNGKGLSDVLAGACTFREAVKQLESQPSLWVLPAGPLPSNPAELLSSSSMEDLLREARRDFEHVVLDSPPLLMVSDAVILSNLADGVVLVVESGVTNRSAVARAYKVLQIAGAKVLGVVLNKLDVRHDGYYGYYYRGYLDYFFSKDVEKLDTGVQASASNPPQTPAVKE
jgi:capsular exopolysaccharide synthesis family protein